MTKQQEEEINLYKNKIKELEKSPEETFTFLEFDFREEWYTLIDTFQDIKKAKEIIKTKLTFNYDNKLSKDELIKHLEKNIHTFKEIKDFLREFADFNPEVSENLSLDKNNTIALLKMTLDNMGWIIDYDEFSIQDVLEGMTYTYKYDGNFTYESGIYDFDGEIITITNHIIGKFKKDIDEMAKSLLLKYRNGLDND